MSRRKFTPEFKESAVKLVNEKGYTIVAAAKSLGIDPNCLRYWVRTLSGKPGMGPKGDGVMAAELQRLRQENTRLLMEREILKKAAAFFAREQL